jgi:GMP synthase-like glutamine amidotransferase
VDHVVLVYSNPLAKRNDLGDLEKAVRKKRRLKGSFGYVELASVLLSNGIEYEPVLGRMYRGENQGLVHVISGVPQETPFSLSDDRNRARVHEDYAWVRDTYGVYGICMGSQILTSIWGGEIFNLNEKRIFNRYRMKWGNGSKAHLNACHGDGAYDVPEGFIPLRKRGGVVYKMANWTMGHIGVQYHPEMNGEGIREMMTDIRRLINTMPEKEGLGGPLYRNLSIMAGYRV